MRVSALALGVGVGNDDVDARQEFPGLHECERMRSAAFGQRDSVVAESAEIDVDGRRVWRTRPLVTKDAIIIA